MKALGIQSIFIQIPILYTVYRTKSQMKLNECRVTKANGGIPWVTKATSQCSTIKAEVSSEMGGMRMGGGLCRKLTLELVL